MLWKVFLEQHICTQTMKVTLYNGIEIVFFVQSI